MKTIFILTLFISISLSGSLHAQYYEFSQHQKAYQPLLNPDFSVTDSAYLDTNNAIIHKTFPLGDFMAFGEVVTGIVEVGRPGYVVALGDVSDFVFDPFKHF